MRQDDPIMPSLGLIGQPYFSLEAGGGWTIQAFFWLEWGSSNA